jgi:putative redox protein
VSGKPPSVIDLTWIGDLKFSAKTSRTTSTLDSAGTAGFSPVETLAAALAGCMSTDVVHILTRGRHPLQALGSHLSAERAQEDPHRILSATLHFTIAGDVPSDAVDRAIALSREKYCSVWHSMRQDIDFQVSWAREPARARESE